MYFDEIEDTELLNDLYRELCKQLHPDRGGNADAFRLMRDEYEQRKAYLAQMADMEANTDGLSMFLKVVVNKGIEVIYKANPQKTAAANKKMKDFLEKNVGQLLGDLFK